MSRTIKRYFFTLSLVCVICGSSLWAFSFTWAPIDPLFREPLADPFAKSTTFRYLAVLDESSVPDSILIADSEENAYTQIPYDDRKLHEYWHMKSAVNIGVLRFDLSSVVLEGYIQGGLNTVFQKKGSINALGFDGMYGAGASVNVYDLVTITAGFHHFSGHWGDEILSDVLERNTELDFWSDDATKRLVEYTRGNSWIAGISIQPSPAWRTYVIAELPMRSAWIRPGVHVPPQTVRPGSEDSQFDHITGQEGITDTTVYDDSYKAWRVQAGAELRFPILSVGSIFVATDVQAHQDGQTKHMVGMYDKENPWEWTFSIGGGFEFNQGILNRKLRLEVFYHDGRFPLLNYFFQRSRYLTIGLGING